MDDAITEQMDYDILIENVYNKVKLHINHDQFDASDIIELVPHLITICESIKNLNGLDKKTICMIVLRRIVNRMSPSDNDKRSVLLKFVNANASKMIDIVVLAANGKMLMKRASKCSNKLFSCIKFC
jgi:tRNA C32,U32 (ribose-2'-O)-methylase TrmJ